MSKSLFFVGGVVALALIGVVTLTPPSASQQDDTVAYAATVYKPLTCECCEEYIAYLQEKGVEVTLENIEDMSAVKEEFGITKDMASCHTTAMGDYFFEGHIPFETLHETMMGLPEIEGIALPGMPAGSPGMPGEQTEPFHMYHLMNGQFTEHMM